MQSKNSKKRNNYKIIIYYNTTNIERLSMRKGIKSIIFSLIISIAASQFAPLGVQAAYKPKTTPSCNAVYFVNEETGKVLYEKNQDEKIYPASITKLMTAIVVYEKYKDKLNTKVTVEYNDIRPLSGTYGSLVPLKVGETLTIEQLLNCLLIRSGDDSANVLAHATAGSIDSFVDMMNEKAEEIGLKNTHYVNPHGLHDDDHYTTAYDCYILAKYAMSIDELAKIVSTSSYTLEATNKSERRKFTNTNSVINDASKYYYKYAKGIKTGTTTPAGACLVSYASRDGVTYYCVCMGGKKTSTSNTAFSDTIALYKWAYGNFEITPVVKTTDTAAQVKLELTSGKDKLLLVPEKQVNALVPKTFKASDLKVKLHVPESVSAPINKGDKLGTEDLYILNKDTGKYESLGTVNLVAGESATLSKPLYVLALVKKFFNSIWFKVVAAFLIILMILYITLSVYYNRRKKMLNRRRRKKVKYKRYR
jgi:D-alanyl-D-alanine carboxypeptidase (penicillin-binding protein 5/6)